MFLLIVLLFLIPICISLVNLQKKGANKYFSVALVVRENSLSFPRAMPDDGVESIPRSR